MDQRDTTQVVRMLTPDERKEMLESINSPADLRKLPVEELPVLARALRDFMVESVSKTGGHLSSSLGATELAIALHYVFNTPEDAIVWDVGHQAYAHKILTGRRDAMATLRQTDGISGFPKRSESPYDSFGTAHSSTSISAALGMAVADSLNGKKDRWHIAVIGDGALTGGMAVEALNHAGVYKKDLRSAQSRGCLQEGPQATYHSQRQRPLDFASGRSAVGSSGQAREHGARLEGP